jgi:DNA-binding transcriptional ArsR family regulator
MVSRRDLVLDFGGTIHNTLVVDTLTLTLTAVADPTRRAILKRLAEGPAPVRELAEPFRISQQAVSKHLACLERARLISKRRDGRLHICKLEPKPLAEVAEWTERYREFWEPRFAKLDALLDELQKERKTR